MLDGVSTVIFRAAAFVAAGARMAAAKMLFVCKLRHRTGKSCPVLLLFRKERPFKI